MSPHDYFGPLEIQREARRIDAAGVTTYYIRVGNLRACVSVPDGETDYTDRARRLADQLAKDIITPWLLAMMEDLGE